MEYLVDADRPTARAAFLLALADNVHFPVCSGDRHAQSSPLEKSQIEPGLPVPPRSHACRPRSPARQARKLRVRERGSHQNVSRAARNIAENLSLIGFAWRRMAPRVHNSLPHRRRVMHEFCCDPRHPKTLLVVGRTVQPCPRRPPAKAANSKTSPNPKTARAAPASNRRPAIRARPELALEYLIATFLASTVVLASAAVVVAVPSDIAKTARTPVEKVPCAKAKTSTRIAPEQGRDPAAPIVNSAPFQENPAPSERGSGACKRAQPGPCA